MLAQRGAELETRVQNCDDKETVILERMVLLLDLVDPSRFLELIRCGSRRGDGVLITWQLLGDQGHTLFRM